MLPRCNTRTEKTQRLLTGVAEAILIESAKGFQEGPVAQPDPIFLRAFETVRGRHSVDEWLSMTPQRMTEDIYKEMRRLDLIKAEKLQQRPGYKQARTATTLVTLHADVVSKAHVRPLPSGLRARVA